MGITMKDVGYSSYVDDNTPVSVFVCERFVGKAMWGEITQCLIDLGYEFDYEFVIEYKNMETGQYVRRLKGNMNRVCRAIPRTPYGCTFTGWYMPKKAPKRSDVVYLDD